MSLTATPLNNTNYQILAGFVLLLLQIREGKDHFKKYENFLTPNDYTMELMSQILTIFQGIFALIQMLPSYRSHALVQDGVQYWFLVACVAQVISGLRLPYGEVFVDMVCMACILYSLMTVMKQQKNATNDDDETVEEFWLLQFIFPLWFACTMVGFLMTLNSLLSYFGIPSIILFIIGLGSLIFLVMAAIYMYSYSEISSPNYVIPGVVAFWIIGMAFNRPNHEMEENFSDLVIILVNVATFLIGIALAYFIGSNFYHNVIEEESGGEDGGVASAKYEGAKLASDEKKSSSVV